MEGYYIEKVSLVKTESYQLETVTKAVQKHFDLLQIKDQIKSKRVVIKPNLLMKRKPEQGTTTHNIVVQAVVIVLQNLGITDIVLADSPGGPYTKSALMGIYQASGMEYVAQKQGIKLNVDTGFKVMECNGEIVKSFEIINPLTNGDYVINVAKLKTHSMTGFSAGVKNMFGSVPGLKKPEFHFRFPDKDHFCNMLVDLVSLVKPDLTILDAVVSMEGDGPSSGELKKTNMTFASCSPFVLDRVICDFIGYKPDEVFTVSNSIRRGLAPQKIENIELLGDEFVPVLDFVKPKTKSLKFDNHIPKVITKIVEKNITPKPIIKTKKCIGCGKCAESCPAKVITITDKRAKISYDKCIKCFCCHEMCPVKAIEIGRFMLWK